MDKKIKKSILICVGIKHYKNNSINKLSYSISDCLQIKRTFHALNLCDLSFILTEKKASLKHIINKIISLSETSIENFFFYYSGHGEYIKNTSYLYTYDTNPNKVLTTSLSIPKLIKSLKSLPFNKLNIILDACNIFNLSTKHFLPTIMPA